MSKYVPPLSLQLLFENVIKHNIVSNALPLSIEVYVDDQQYLVVKNVLQLKRQTMPSTGMGLSNISKRIAYFTDKSIIVDSSENFFKVKMPLINYYKPISNR